MQITMMQMLLMKTENIVKKLPGLLNKTNPGKLLEWMLVYMILDRVTNLLKDKSNSSILEGIRQRQNEVRILSRGDSKYLKQFLEDEVIRNPEFFYVSGFKYYIRGNETIVIPTYTYSLKEVQELTERCERIANGLIKRSNSDDTYERVKMLHDFLVRNVVYENDGKKERHNIIGPLIEKKSVCDGFSVAFKFLLDKIGIPCIVVTGTAWDQQSGSDGNHAWNLVELENQWTHIDVTFDTTMSSYGVIRYDYFGLTTEKIQRDHRYDKSNLPKVSTTFEDYYTRDGAVIYGKKAFQQYALNMIKKHIYDFAVKLPYETPDLDIENKVSIAIRNILVENNLRYEYVTTYNTKQMVFQVHFKEI